MSKSIGNTGKLFRLVRTLVRLGDYSLSVTGKGSTPLENTKIANEVLSSKEEERHGIVGCQSLNGGNNTIR
jgi:hypothetical protein